ncbi:hypothetical protein ACT3UG_01230 [Halomonas sp. AOP27-A1-34]|uniref:hypothetical protein n=1 Tax=Halomonas sp. AOP27-A1-34 TaxID=3457708 RepID=UPI0040348007
MSDPKDLADLVAALHAQTEAFNRLADSNNHLIDFLVGQEAEGLDGDGSGAAPYLDPDEE